MTTKAVTGVACTIGGAACLTGMVIEGFRYSPGGDQGVMTVCVALFWAALALLAVPAVMIVIWFTGELHRDLRRAGLSAGQAALVEAGAMGVAGYEWSKYNREWSGRLTDSVMGPERTGTWPDGR